MTRATWLLALLLAACHVPRAATPIRISWQDDPELYATIERDGGALACLAQAAKRKGEFAGHVLADVEVREDGRASATITSATVPVDGELRRCLKTTVASLRLLRLPSAGRVIAGVTWRWEPEIHAVCRPPANLDPHHVWGCADMGIIGALIPRHATGLEACRDGFPAAAEQVTVNFQLTIDRTGRVIAVALSEDHPLTGSLHECLAHTAKEWRFPPLMGSGHVVVRYPIGLNTSKVLR
jgi:hypothetical protein